MKRLVSIVAVVVAVIVGMLVAGWTYYRVGWTRMDYACSAGPFPGEATQVGFSFTDRGFTCTYNDGTVRSTWGWF